MTPQTHITDDLLVEYAAAQPNEAVSLIVACHLALCVECRSVIGLLDEVGALYAQNAAPIAVGREAIQAVVGRLDSIDRSQPEPDASPIPPPLQAYVGTANVDEIEWQAVVPGHWRARLDIDTGGGGLFLGRFAGGFRVPGHGHAGRELVMPLTGGFSQDGAQFGPGDIAIADPSVEHEVVVDAHGECIALVSNEVDPQ
jgi:putative transcriptional regulator